MKRKKTLIRTINKLMLFLIFVDLGCRRDVSNLKAPSFPTTADVFIDDFTSDLAYSAFGTSDVTAFHIDYQETYNNSKASIRIEVPDVNSPNGSYAGGVFFSKTGRNLSSYNALTFYIKASQPATIGVVGLGNDLSMSMYQVSLNNLQVNSNWKKVIIPIPDASKLIAEKGLFYYSASPINGSGYTVWIDQVMFENLPNLANLEGSIQGGHNDSIPFAIAGNYDSITNYQATVNLPTGVNETVNITPYYFTLKSSNSSVASVSQTGGVNILGSGTATITAVLGSKTALGSLKINSIGTLNPPPAPTRDAANVLSLLTSAYHNVPVDYWNGYWAPYQVTTSNIAKAGNDTIIQYSNLNFVGAQLTSPTQNITSYRSFHIDIYTPDVIASNSSLQIQLLDFGPNGVAGGGDDVTGTLTIPSSFLASKKWISIDTLLAAFTGLTTKAHFGQIIFVGNNLPDLWIDNVYFWRYPPVPTVAAPTPTQSSSNVLSIFSDAYTNVTGTDFFPNWGQQTVVSQIKIAGNNTLHYAGLNYEGTQLASNQNVSSYGFLHVDYYSTNSSSLSVFLISPGPVQTAYQLTAPTNGWNSVDIPLSAFSPVDLSNVFQLMFVGDGNDVYIDNIYFWKIPLVPTTPAPTPTYNASNVISIFSDSYTAALPNIDYFPNWGQQTVVSQVSIAGNNTLLYTGLNYEGTQFDPSSSGINVTSMNYLHVDYYTANSTALQVFLISPGPVQTSYTLSVPSTSGWNTVDIPLSAFSPVDLSNVFQMMFVGNGTIYLDNILFHK
ncbi:MAG TPA: hypothetical protein VHD35_14310 [Chitinophagaceae bacterium]|nr:hypothetical protein [Chitinophagaceae bacterium]